MNEGFGSKKEERRKEGRKEEVCVDWIGLDWDEYSNVRMRWDGLGFKRWRWGLRRQ